MLVNDYINFEIGARVTLKPGKYSNTRNNPLDVQGSIIELRLPNFCRVKWDNGMRNSYHRNDLMYEPPLIVYPDE